MTCDGVCSQCFYGWRTAEYRCGNKNITCDGECHKCPYRQEKAVKYVCNRTQRGERHVTG